MRIRYCLWAYLPTWNIKGVLLLKQSPYISDMIITWKSDGRVAPDLPSQSHGNRCTFKGISKQAEFFQYLRKHWTRRHWSLPYLFLLYLCFILNHGFDLKSNDEKLLMKILLKMRSIYSLMKHSLEMFKTIVTYIKQSQANSNDALNFRIFLHLIYSDLVVFI